MKGTGFVELFLTLFGHHPPPNQTKKTKLRFDQTGYIRLLGQLRILQFDSFVRTARVIALPGERQGSQGVHGCSLDSITMCFFKKSSV